jgi:hypothetical protein
MRICNALPDPFGAVARTSAFANMSMAPASWCRGRLAVLPGAWLRITAPSLGGDRLHHLERGSEAAIALRHLS